MRFGGNPNARARRSGGGRPPRQSSGERSEPVSPVRNGFEQRLIHHEYQKAGDMLRAFGIHDPTGNRTPIYAVRGRCPSR